jgi:hypothetical protein
MLNEPQDIFGVVGDGKGSRGSLYLDSSLRKPRSRQQESADIWRSNCEGIYQLVRTFAGSGAEMDYSLCKEF